MTLEQSLEKIVIEQKNLIEIRRNKDILFLGIEAIDELLSGFEERFKYCFIANEGMGSKVIIDTILKNFSLIYNFRYQWNVDTCILDKLESGEFSMENNYKPFLMVILSEDVMKRKNHNKRPTLNDLPLEIQDNSDVVIS
ncbi:MAG: hypothetical protein U1C58_13810, partial [Flavobacteriaceae bacterium]|nr:hypothetical protein [Flavobacteriaceae bacterium]